MPISNNALDVAERNNFQHKPGCHSIRSPLPGSRFHELFLIDQFQEIFVPYQEILYTKQKIHVIPLAYKKRADELSKQLYETFLSKYPGIGLTADNAVCWSTRYYDAAKCRIIKEETAETTWHSEATVPHLEAQGNIIDGQYCPPYIAAIHELMHVEERPKGQSDTSLFENVREVLTVTQTIILLDEVYKETMGLDRDALVDYGTQFDISGKKISQGELANFYRDLSKKYPSLAEALVSPESMRFLNSDPELVKIGQNRLANMDQRRLYIEQLQRYEQSKNRFIADSIAEPLNEISILEKSIPAAKIALNELEGKKSSLSRLLAKNTDEERKIRLTKMFSNFEEEAQKIRSTIPRESERLHALKDSLEQIKIDAIAIFDREHPPIPPCIEVSTPSLQASLNSSSNETTYPVGETTPLIPEPDRTNYGKKLGELKKACDLYIRHHRKNDHASILNLFLQKYPLGQDTQDISIYYQQVLLILHRSKNAVDKEEYSWFLENKMSILGAIKYHTINWLRMEATCGETNSKQVFTQLREKLCSENNKIMEILALDRQSSWEYALKILSLITVIFAIIPAGIHLYQTNGKSLNFFKPLSEQTVKEELQGCLQIEASV